MKKILVLASLMLASCNREEQPQAPTAAESDQLNEAEDLLNELGNEEGLEAEAPSPSNRSE